MTMWVCQSTFNALRFGLWLALLSGIPSATSLPSAAGEAAPPRSFAAKGVVLSVNREERQLVIRHEAISNYMTAMTMPFKVKTRDELQGLQPGDVIAFQLQVDTSESWVQRVAKVGAVSMPPADPPVAPVAHPPRAFHLTNELGQPVSLNDFRGQALAITFIYTRCPLPDYCPRLSRNFQEASQLLAARPGAPANWHFLSISFDPEFDTPPMLEAYAKGYHYDPRHWSFLTGPTGEIAELARQAGVSYQPGGGAINHNFRTLIVDAGGRLQMIFPTSGDLSAAIVGEMLKAVASTNSIEKQDHIPTR